MQGNAVAFLASAIKGDRSDSESAPERSSPSPTHLWVSEERSGQRDGVLSCARHQGRTPACRYALALSPRGRSKKALWAQQVCQHTTKLHYQAHPRCRYFPPFPSFWNARWQKWFGDWQCCKQCKTGVEDEVQGATEQSNSSRQISHANVPSLHYSQSKGDSKRAESNINLFQLLILQVVLWASVDFDATYKAAQFTFFLFGSGHPSLKIH